MRFTSSFALHTTSVAAAVMSVLILTAVAQRAEPAKRSSVSVLADVVVLDQPTMDVPDEWNSKG